MEPLWTPWRMPYILEIKADRGCVFCEEVLADRSDPDLVIHRGRHAFVLMNLYPYTTGHLMVVPYRHVASMGDLAPEEIEEAAGLMQHAERAVEAALGIRRHHAGINLGRCAGAGVEGHLHIHLVPHEPGESRPSHRPGELPPRPLIETRDLLARGWAAVAVQDHSATS